MQKPLTTPKSPGQPSPRDPCLAALGLRDPDASALTSYSREGLREAALIDLLIRGLATGDEHPVDGAVATIADELAAFSALMGESDNALGTLLNNWSVRLRVAAELVRRYREQRAAPAP